MDALGTTDMTATVRGLQATFALNGRLFLNTLDGVSDAHGDMRVGATNSMKFIAAHLVDVRHFTVRYLGRDVENPLGPLLSGVERIEDAPELPDMATLCGYWRDVSAVLDDVVAKLDATALAAASSQRFPIDDGTVLGGSQFLLHHEAYHIGQLAILRKHHGYPAMKYR